MEEAVMLQLINTAGAVYTAIQGIRRISRDASFTRQLEVIDNTAALPAALAESFTTSTLWVAVTAGSLALSPLTGPVGLGLAIAHTWSFVNARRSHRHASR
jgi:hypothetical protein